MFKRLRNKLLLLNLTIISIVMIAAFTAIYFITYTNIQKENQSRLESNPLIPRVHQSLLPPIQTEIIDPQLSQEHTRTVFMRMPIDHSLSFSIMVDENGQVLNVLTSIDMPEELYDQLAELTWQKGKDAGTIALENRKWQYQMTYYDRTKVRQDLRGQRIIFYKGHYLITYLDITESNKTLTQLLITFVIVGIAMIFIIFGISYYFANRSIRPIEESWQKQKQFVADASHELKTPLAIINANADALLSNGETTVNSQRKWINYIQSEAGRMGKLVNDMLYLAKVEDSTAHHLPFNFSNTVLDVAAAMEAVIFEKNIKLTQSIERNITVNGDEEKIKQAVLILLDNATKYCEAHGSIDICLNRTRNQAVFSITNSGKGIPADKLPRIFDRFYRCDPSRSQEIGGYGLGLSIAKAIIERAGGNINATSTENSTTFTFTLKLI